MLVFLILFVLAIFFTIFEGKKFANVCAIQMEKRQIFVGARCLFLIMFILCAFRGVNVGIDTSHYYDSFQFGISRSVEISYWTIREISLILGNSFQLFLAIYAFVSLYPFWRMLKRESVNISFSLLIYLSFSHFFYPEVFNTIRATAAIGIFTIALSYWSAKQYKFSLLLLAISCLFHNSAIVASVILVCVQLTRRFPQTMTVAALIASVIFGLAFQTGFSEYAERLSLLLGGFSGDHMDYYSNYFTGLTESNFNIVGTLANMLPFTLFAIFLYDDENSTDIFYKLFVVGSILSNVFISVLFIYRITMFFTVLVAVVLPNSYRRIKGMRLMIVKSLISFMLLWYLYVLFGSSDGAMAGTIPYSFCFE